MDSDKREQNTKLQLAIAWNKYDIVMSDILKDASKWSNLDLDYVLKNALRRYSVNFVDIFIEHGASFERLQRLINITDFYEDLYRKAPQEKLYLSSDLYEKIAGSAASKSAPQTKQQNYTAKEMQDAYYETYLGKRITTHYYATKKEDHDPALDDAYGFLDHFRKKDSFLNGMLTFSCNDVIRNSGHITSVSINFSKLLIKPHKSSSPEHSPSMFLYIISPTKGEDKFIVAHRHQLSDGEITKLLLSGTESQSSHQNLPNVRTVLFHEPTLYLEAGQFLGIGFAKFSGRPYHLKGSDSYYIDLGTANNALKTGETQTFIKQAIYCAAFSFTIRPTQSFLRELLLWSLFSDRMSLATCLCSRSENTIAATLLASKICWSAAEIQSNKGKKKEYQQKAKEFDNHAAQIMEACYRIDETFAVEILTTESKLYYNYSPLKMADENNSRRFLATDCVQKHLDKLWYGKVDRHHHSFFIHIVILLLATFPPLIPIVAKYTSVLSLKKTEDESSSESKWTVVRFYHQRGVIRFYYGIIFYIGFLGLFSFVLLVDYFPLNNNNGKRNGYENIAIPITEILLHIGASGFILEEFIEFGLFFRHNRKRNSHSIFWIFCRYFRDDKWNILDCFIILSYLIGFATRFFVCEAVFAASKIFMCCSLFLWYIRILHLFVVSERLGTKLLMIFNTMKDLSFFVCFILIFLIGYSVTSYSLITTTQQVNWIQTQDNSLSTMYTLTQEGTGLWNWTILRNVIDWGMWKIYGQVELLDHSQVDGNTLNADNDVYGNVVFVLTIIFVCIANVLLLNVLVALFNMTLEKTKDDAHTSWAYQRFLLVNEYNKKSRPPSPFNLIYYIWKIMYYLYACAKKSRIDKVYGSLDGKSKLDSNIYDAITFNALDQAKFGGTINTVSINFSTPPDDKAPKISLFIIAKFKNANSPDTFSIIKEHRLVTEIENIRRDTGVQKIPITQLEIRKGQYLGIRFSPGAGNPFSAERNQYYCYFDDEPYPGQPLKFTRCRTKGITMSFQVQPAKGDAEESKKSKTSDDKQDTRAGRYTYRTYDNILRERSIAQGYWKNIVERLKKEERDTNQQFGAEESNWKQVEQLVHQSDKNQNRPEFSNK